MKLKHCSLLTLILNSCFGLLPTLCLVSASSTQAAEIRSWNYSTIDWKIERPNGAKLTFLEGIWETAGPITYAFKMKDGTWYPLNTHPSDARIVVLQGTLLLGHDESSDPAKATALPAGSVAIVPAGVPHYEGAQGDTVIVGFTIGPWSTTFIKK